jgi:hypothetical protein
MAQEISPDDLDAIQAVIADFTRAEAQLEEAKGHFDSAGKQVLGQVADLRAKLDTPYAPALIGVLRHLYWQQPGINAHAISAAAGFDYHQQMLNVLGSSPSGIACAGCGKDLRRTSRSWQPPYNKLCHECDHQHEQARNRSRDIEGLRCRLTREAQLTAPARDWLAVTALIIAYPPLTTGTVPGSEDPSDISVWTGWEHGRRIQQELQRAGVLGDAPFTLKTVDAARLIRTASSVVAWDSSRTVEIFGAFTAESAHVLLMRLRRLVDEAEATAGARAQNTYPDDYEPSEEDLRQLGW